MEKEGKKSSPAIMNIIYKKEPPEINVNEPENGRKFFGEDKTVTIRGTTENDARLSVNDRFIIVEPDGDFEYSASLNEGENKFIFKASDVAGNSHEIEFKLEYSP